MGRRKGGHNHGYFYRSGRGWYAKIDGKFRALEFENGDRMRAKNTPAVELKAAHKRLIATPEPEEPTNEPTVTDVCSIYLKQVESAGAKATLTSRTATLFDFCFGLPCKFAPIGGKPRPKPTAKDYIHKGFGRIAVSKLLPLHLDQ